MSISYAKVGICKSLIIPLNCDGTVNTDAEQIPSCNLTDIEENPILTEGLSLSDPSGSPNRDCVKIEIDPEFDAFELVITTCSLFDTRLDAAFGYSEEMVNGLGSKALKKQGANCICQCGEENCKLCFAVVTWSLAYCAGINERHPDGKYVMTVYPQVCPRPNTATRTTNRELNSRQYLGRIYENPDFGQGIQIDGEFVVPADEAPFDRCKYEYVTNICPPDACDCGTCESSMTMGGGAPLRAAVGRRAAPPAGVAAVVG